MQRFSAKKGICSTTELHWEACTGFCLPTQLSNSIIRCVSIGIKFCIRRVSDAIPLPYTQAEALIITRSFIMKLNSDLSSALRTPTCERKAVKGVGKIFNKHIIECINSLHNLVRTLQLSVSDFDWTSSAPFTPVSLLNGQLNVRLIKLRGIWREIYCVIWIRTTPSMSEKQFKSM